jgi:hypothetical protein
MGRQRGAKGELVSRGQQHRVGVIQLTDVGALVINGQRPDMESAVGDDPAMVLHAVGLHRERPSAPPAQRPTDEAETLGEAGTDHDLIGACLHPTRSRQIIGQRMAQLRTSAGV